jgi:hypothetical protein
MYVPSSPSSEEYNPSTGNASEQGSQESKPLSNPLSVLEIEKPKVGGEKSEEEKKEDDNIEGGGSTNQTKSINIILN